MVDALRILFVEIVQTAWAHEFPWDYWRKSGKELPAEHASISRAPLKPDMMFKDSNRSAQAIPIKEKYQDVFTRLITEIRVRQYSIRTEQA